MICRALVLVAGVTGSAGPVLAAGLSLDTGKAVVLSCETQSVVVAPEAATTKGTIQVRLTAVAGATSGGTWATAEVATQHSASFAGRHRALCVDGCEFALVKGTSFELWAPKKAAPGSLGAGVALTVAVIDGATMKLRASTFIDKEIAALEHGTCSVVP
ncbi:MAG: hypothetical protein ABL901_17200 [Hyphomicrobiaceae bacterium]